MKYSKRFQRDYAFYLANRDRFSFDGCAEYVNKKGESLIQESSDGCSAKEAFYAYDSKGEINPTCEPGLLEELYRCKGSINLHISMWAEGRAEGTFPGVEFEEYAKEVGLLPWVVDAVEKQKWRYYKLS